MYVCISWLDSEKDFLYAFTYIFNASIEFDRFTYSYIATLKFSLYTV